MRMIPPGFTPLLRAQWIAVVMHEVLGRDSLAGAPALLSGYRSISRHPALAQASVALRNLRLLGVSVLSDAQLREAVREAVLWEQEHRNDADYQEPPFRLQVGDDRFLIHPREGSEIQRGAMYAALTHPLELLDNTTERADPARSFRFRHGGDSGFDVVLDAAAAQLRDPEIEPLPEPAARGPITVTMADLEEIAADLDRIDAISAGRTPRNFLRRLRDFDGSPVFSVMTPEGSSLARSETLTLEGTSHMIGLPGAGKSTLIFLITVLLSRRGKRIALLVPSIEFALSLEADLEDYGVPTALLVGQSPDTRRRHASRLAERIAIRESGGFGHTAPGADLLGTRCALSGFVSHPASGFDFPHDAPPCIDIRQPRLMANGQEAEQYGTRLCPLSGSCGRQRSSRQLAAPSALVHIGHVHSTDVQISPHFHQEAIRHFERIARTMDLVIVDEADGAQAALDDKGLNELDLFGHIDSYEAQIVRDLLTPAAHGRDFSTAHNVQNYRQATNSFITLNNKLRGNLLDRLQEPGSILARFKDAFVTGNTILAALYLGPDEDGAFGSPTTARFEAIRKLFDQLVMAASRYGFTDDDGPDLALDRVAIELGIDHTRLLQAASDFQNGALDYFNGQLIEDDEAAQARIRDAFFSILPPTRPGLDVNDAAILFRFLFELTTVVQRFLGLVPAQYSMTAEGVHKERILARNASNDLLRNTPESLVGRLSGIRFTYEKDKSNRSRLKLQYLSFEGAPRLLLYHLSELCREDGLDGPAVMFASATSFMAPSPSYHIPIRPAFILKRENEAQAWRDSVFAFRPVLDADKAGLKTGRKYVRVSGGGTTEEREAALLKLATHFFAGPDPYVRQLREDTFDPARGRRTGIVVNSYDQVRLIKAHLKRTITNSHRIIGVTNEIREIPTGDRGEWVTVGQVEALGGRDDWDALVFPMKAIGRGVNIVFPDGEFVRDAVLGTIAFFVRPHPTGDSLSFTSGTAGRFALDFDRQQFDPSLSISELTGKWRDSRDVADRKSVV